MKEVFRVLKSDGLFALVEMEGTTGNAYHDKEKRGILAAYTYSVGLYLRKPEDDPTAGKRTVYAQIFRNHRDVVSMGC